MQNNVWPNECVRCKDTEFETGRSVRLASLERHKILSKIRLDYLILGGTLDNVCNSACQSCNENLSTKIGSLKSKHYPIIDNGSLFDTLPKDRIVELDINGGEPTVSPRYQQIVSDLPTNCKILRVNTNGGRILPNLQKILEKGIKVIVTISLDGIGHVHDYVRWPIKWQNFNRTVQEYLHWQQRYSNLVLQAWTTVHALNIADFYNIRRYAKAQGLQHDWAFLETPEPLSVKFTNSWTRNHKAVAEHVVATQYDNQMEIDQFIADQDKMRGIMIKDYL